MKKSKRVTFIISFLFLCIFAFCQSVLAQDTWRERWKKKSDRSLFGLGGKDYRMPVVWITKPWGCGPGDYGRRIKFQGLIRFYKFHVPRGYKKGKPTAVVLAFHGGGGYPGALRYQCGMDSIADRENFIVVYPAGTSRTGFKDRLLTWNDGRPFTDGAYSKIDDVGFVNALLDDLAGYYAIDPNRIYACGFSNGAQFTNRLAQQLSNRIAAIAAVAGHRSADDRFFPPPRPISKMQFSGLKDYLAPYEGGAPPPKTKKGGIKVDFKFTLEPVKETIQSWAKHNGCPWRPSKTKKIGKAIMTRYGPGRDNTEVILWTLKDGGHTWPGGKMTLAEKAAELGPINQDISASELIWEFFKKHPKR